ncbi:MAG: hypothetical protein WAV47_26725 [Blastocatellia bacterium]
MSFEVLSQASEIQRVKSGFDPIREYFDLEFSLDIIAFWAEDACINWLFPFNNLVRKWFPDLRKRRLK